MPLSSVVGAQSIVKPGVCTSSTRPASPFEGQMIYETDTDILAIWNGTAWRQLAAATKTGSVLQVQSTTVTAITASTSSASFGDITGLSASITPMSTSSKIFVKVDMNVGANGAVDNSFFNLNRGSTALSQGVGATENCTAAFRFSFDGAGAQSYQLANIGINFLDSPSSVSALTYKMQWKIRVGTIYLNRAADTNIGTSSTITLMEIAG